MCVCVRLVAVCCGYISYSSSYHIYRSSQPGGPCMDIRGKGGVPTVEPPSGAQEKKKKQQTARGRQGKDRQEHTKAGLCVREATYRNSWHIAAKRSHNAGNFACCVAGKPSIQGLTDIGLSIYLRLSFLGGCAKKKNELLLLSEGGCFVCL